MSTDRWIGAEAAVRKVMAAKDEIKDLAIQFDHMELDRCGNDIVAAYRLLSDIERKVAREMRNPTERMFPHDD
jgi:hypothetical protein